MPGSQLKRLKASLRDQGVIGPQQSKKQKRKNAQDGKAAGIKRQQKAAGLQNIREEFNPFDLKHNVRGPKFDVTTNRPATGYAARGISGRPTDAKAAGEERRRQTLLHEMQRRNKVGGIHDRRFGENDPTMSLEQKMQERFVREKLSHKSSMFDLEDDEPNAGLTHLGKSLFENASLDDFDEDDLAESGSEDQGDERYTAKRLRGYDVEDDDGEEVDGQPERKKTKQEVYKEIIAKSKFHKAERQAQKDEDDDLREELDRELGDVRALLLNPSRDSKRNDGTAAETTAGGREQMERDYDLRLKALAMDRRAQASERTKSEGEKAQEALQKLQDLETRKAKRMRGEAASDSDEESRDGSPSPGDQAHPASMFAESEDEDAFGLGEGIKRRPTAGELGFDDEDDFVVEDDLLASGSDLEPLDSEDSSGEEDADDDDDDDEFTKGLLNEDEAQDPAFQTSINGSQNDRKEPSYSCPDSLSDLVEMTSAQPVNEIPSVIRKIRILFHPKLANENRTKLGAFASVLPRFLRHLTSLPNPSFATIEAIIRHIHSMAKAYPIEIANEFRAQIVDFATRPLSPTLGDLVMLSAIGIIFPPSDHFHQVTSPAMLVIARYLGQKIPRQLTDYTQGIFLCTLVLQYQHYAKRWVPEFMNFCLNTLVALAPKRPGHGLGLFPSHEPPSGTRITDAHNTPVRKLKPSDCVQSSCDSLNEDLTLKVSVVTTVVKLLDAATDIYSGKASFIESFLPVDNVLAHLASTPCNATLPPSLNDNITKLRMKLGTMLRVAKLARRPLELHHHRPLAIKTAIPKFEDQFDPDKHYDNDRDRAELAKLKAEHKKERKGAMRELRKDASFMAREKLKQKKEKDAAYEKKYKRLVAEIQGEEGREANAYAKEKEMRKRSNKK
ncbi:Nop14-like protein [Xylariaceae sp. FL0016]|nr:Nop14-like protein [Xylariaceae sp. FL0016]